MRHTVTFNSLGHYGRLANGMYQIAGTIGIARRNGFDFAFPEWKNYDHRDRFGSSEDIDLQKYFVNPLPLYDGVELPDYFVHWGYHEVDLNRSVSLSGHMQSTRYFEHCLDEVRHYFRMKDEPEQNDYCAIHVRLGDYDNAYHPCLDMRYYGPAMAEFPDSKFLVFSDDLVVAQMMFATEAHGDVDYARGNYIEDFKLMKRCKNFIIGNSSYSAMAAVLGEHPEKKVIAPRPWFGYKYTQIDGEDIYERSWKVVNWQLAA